MSDKEKPLKLKFRQVGGGSTDDSSNDNLGDIKELLKNIELELKRIYKIENDIKDIKTFIQKVQKLESGVGSLRKSVEFMSTKYGEMQDYNKKSDKKIKDLTDEIAVLKSQCGAKDDLLIKFANLDQYHRNRNVEIQGVKELPNEDCADIIVNIANEININIEKTDIDVPHRLKKPKGNRPAAIIAQFKSCQKRDLLLTEKKHTTLNNHIPGTDIGENTSSSGLSRGPASRGVASSYAPPPPAHQSQPYRRRKRGTLSHQRHRQSRAYAYRPKEAAWPDIQP